MAVVLERRLWTADEFHRLGELGILGEDDRVELIHGEIVTMSPIGDRQSGAVNRLNELLRDHLGKTVTIAVQNPIRLENASEPLPDISILKRRADFYSKKTPRPKDIFLLIEVADSSIDYDEKFKSNLYAESNIAEVWVVNLLMGIVIQFTEPFAGKYKRVRRAHKGDSITSHSLPNLTLRVDEIVGEN